MFENGRLNGTWLAKTTLFVSRPKERRAQFC
jgi:hypothetical protein